MDPVNLSGTQNTPSDRKTHAGIRSPEGCACCGLKDYPQNIPQAYCFTALCPGLSKCKSPQDHPQDNFAIPHPLFSSFPFQQHIFHNPIMTPNFCCSQKRSDEGHFKDSNQRQSRSEHKINQHQADSIQKENSHLEGTNRNINENAQKRDPAVDPQATLPNSNPTESQPNTAFQRCICGNSIPWTCRPFIVPVLSYCFLWNSQTASTLLPKTYNSYRSETLCQKNSKKQANQKSSCASDCQEQTHELNQEPSVSNHDSIKISQESLKVNKLGETELKTEEQEEGTEQEESECVKNDSDVNYDEEEDDSETGDDSEIRDQTESEESLKVENDGPAHESIENLSKDHESDHGSPDTDSSTNLKSPPKSSEQSLNDALSVKTGKSSATEVEVKNPSVVSNEESEDKNSDSEDPDTSKTYLKEVVIKKRIKNFTVTDQINAAPSRVQMSAAGDLGGESCDGCKIQTSLDENNEETSKESFNTGVENKESETNVSVEGDEKNVDEIQSPGYKFKSGIAKLSNSNLKTPKPSTLKTTKKCKNYCNEKQSNGARIKHCCFPTENKNSKSESGSKIQKAKKCTKCTVVQKPTTVSGSEIPKKSLNTRQTLKKENLSRKPARPVHLSDNSQKSVKTLLKK